MGSLCSKESNKSNFVGPGRVLGSAPPREANPRAPLPSGTAQKGAGRGVAQQGPGRTLGSATESRNPGAAAAQAAEERLKKTSTSGKLAEQLAAQKRKSNQEILREAADENRRQRDVDAAVDARAWQ